MPLMSKKGLIDPLSLIGLGLFLTALIVGTNVVVNHGSLDIRNWAMGITDNTNNNTSTTTSLQVSQKINETSPVNSQNNTTSDNSSSNDSSSKKKSYCSNKEAAACDAKGLVCSPTTSGGTCKKTSPSAIKKADTQATTSTTDTTRATTPTTSTTQNTCSGLWFENKCYLEGQVVDKGYISCPPESGYGYRYWHVYKGTSCYKTGTEEITSTSVTATVTKLNCGDRVNGDTWCPQGGGSYVNQCNSGATITINCAAGWICPSEKSDCELAVTTTLPNLNPADITNMVYYNNPDPGMGSKGDNEAVLAMLFASFANPGITPNLVLDKYPPRTTLEQAGLQPYLDVLSNNNFQVTKIDTSVSDEKLKNYLAGGNLLYVSMPSSKDKNHYTLVVGTDSAGNFVLLDPDYGKETTTPNIQRYLIEGALVKPPKK